MKKIIILIIFVSIGGFLCFLWVWRESHMPGLRCRDNLLSICGVKEIWAYEHHKTNGDIITWDDLVGQNKYMRDMPICPYGGKYTLGRIGETPTCTILDPNLIPQTNVITENIFNGNSPTTIPPPVVVQEPLATPTSMVLIDALSISTLNTNEHGFYIDSTEVTLAQWKDIYRWAIHNGYRFGDLGDNPRGEGKSNKHPVVMVDWYDAVKWCNARSEMERRIPAYYISGTRSQRTVYRSGELDILNDWVDWHAGYRLPEEAEWSLATRVIGKPLPPVSLGLDPERTASIQPVASSKPNEYGLYDMTGNVHEWCWDKTEPEGSLAYLGRMIRIGISPMSISPHRRQSYVGFRTVLPK